MERIRSGATIVAEASRQLGIAPGAGESRKRLLERGGRAAVLFPAIALLSLSIPGEFGAAEEIPRGAPEPRAAEVSVRLSFEADEFDWGDYLLALRPPVWRAFHRTLLEELEANPLPVRDAPTLAAPVDASCD